VADIREEFKEHRDCFKRAAQMDQRLAREQAATSALRDELRHAKHDCEVATSKLARCHALRDRDGREWAAAEAKLEASVSRLEGENKEHKASAVQYLGVLGELMRQNKTFKKELKRKAWRKQGGHHRNATAAHPENNTNISHNHNHRHSSSTNSPHANNNNSTINSNNNSSAAPTVAVREACSHCGRSSSGPSPSPLAAGHRRMPTKQRIQAVRAARHAAERGGSTIAARPSPVVEEVSSDDSDAETGPSLLKK
jgi:hypothetical protein